MSIYKVLVAVFVLFLVATPSVVGFGSAVVAPVLAYIGSTVQNAVFASTLFYGADMIGMWYGN